VHVKTAGTRHLGMATQWSTRMLEAHPWQRLAEVQCAGWSRRLASDVPASSTFFRPFLQLHSSRILPSCLQIKVFVMQDTVLLSTITLQLTLSIFKCSIGFTQADIQLVTASFGNDLWRLVLSMVRISSETLPFFKSLCGRIFTWYAILYYEAKVTSFHNLTSSTQTTIFALHNLPFQADILHNLSDQMSAPSAAARFLGLGIWLSVSFERCVLSGRWRCLGLITERGVPECDLEASIIRIPWPIRGCAM